MSEAKKEAERMFREATKHAPRGTWLLVFPASGTVRRLNGRFFVLDLGGESGVAPFVFLDGDREVMTLDPRALVLNDRTLVPVWQPRDHLHHSHPASARWYAANPDVFKPEIENKVSAI